MTTTTTPRMSTPTRIEVDHGRCVLGQGPIAARRLRSDDGVVRIALVATQALLLAGDRVRIEVTVTGSDVELVEVGGTVAYDMRGGSARWEVVVRLHDGAHLTWLGQPFVVAAGADVHRCTEVDLAPGTTVTLRESLVLGRTGETGGRLTTATRVRAGGAPLLAEDLDLAPASRVGHAVLGTARCLDSLTTLGHRLADGPSVLQLAGVGSIARWLGDDQHRSPLERLPLARTDATVAVDA